MEEKVEELMEMIKEGSNTESILKTLKESEIKDSAKIIKFIEKFVELKKEESNKLISFIEADEFDLNECINIITKFPHVFLFIRIVELDL